MNFIKKLYYMAKHEFHSCAMCHATGEVSITGLQGNASIEGFESDATGTIKIPCPACEGTKIVWGVTS